MENESEGGETVDRIKTLLSEAVEETELKAI